MGRAFNMSGSADGGGYLHSIQSISASAVRTTAYISWTDPNDAGWRGTKILRKIGAYPESISDGVQVIDSKIRDQYATTMFQDSGLTVGHTYYYQAFPYGEAGSNLSPDNRAMPLLVNDTSEYGVSWAISNSSPVLTRIADSAGFANPIRASGTGAGSSPFDALMPWAGMRECNVDSKGRVTAYKGDPNFSRLTRNVMIEIPKFWCKINGNMAVTPNLFHDSLEIRIASGPISGHVVHPAFRRSDGSTRDAIYVARYESSSLYLAGRYTFFSVSQAVLPTSGSTISDYRTGARLNGAGWEMMDVAAWEAIKLLYLVEYANFNSQNTVAFGNSNSGAKLDTGRTDSMIYHTGGENPTNAYAAMQYRGIENLWGNMGTLLEGICCLTISNGMRIEVSTHPQKWASADVVNAYTDGSMYQMSSGTNIYSKGFAYTNSISSVGSATSDNLAMLQGSVANSGGSSSTFLCDTTSALSSTTFTSYAPMVGGDCQTGDSGYDGIFYVYNQGCQFYPGASSSSSFHGIRLMYLPNK